VAEESGPVREVERRPESPLQRSDRQFGELLQELRVVLPGVQVLFAFLLTMPFSARFDRTTEFQQDLYFVTLLLTTAATVLLMAPTALHRLRFRRGLKGDIVTVSHHLTLGGLAALGLAIVCAVTLVTDVLFALWVAVTVGGAVLAVIVGLWLLFPLSLTGHPPDDR
jgi:Family of unknown function (DUF6328)